MKTESAVHRFRPGVLVAVFAIALMALSLFAAGKAFTPGAGAAPAKAKAKAKQRVILGSGGAMPEARCPADCLGMAIVTGLQTKLNGINNPFRVPFNGKITAWKLGLGKPDKFQRKFFTSRFGDKPKAGIAILKRVRVKGKVRYLLRKRSPVIGLNRDLGKVASFKLKKPIKVAKGNFVALTVPTWAPAMAMPRGITRSGFNWRASRKASTCNKMIGPKTSRPQQGIGSKRPYDCRFNGGQLLYRVKVASR